MQLWLSNAVLWLGVCIIALTAPAAVPVITWVATGVFGTCVFLWRADRADDEPRNFFIGGIGGISYFVAVFASRSITSWGPVIWGAGLWLVFVPLKVILSRQTETTTPAEISELLSGSGIAGPESPEGRNAELVSKVLDVAVYRMTTCPLAAELLTEFKDDEDGFRAAKTRYVIFTSWCARGAVYVHTKTHKYGSLLLAMTDELIERQLEQLCDDDGTSIDVALEAFSDFDRAIKQDEADGHNPDRGRGWFLGNTVASFVFGSRFTAFAPDPRNPQNWARMSALPIRVFLEIVTAAKPILAEIR